MSTGVTYEPLFRTRPGYRQERSYGDLAARVGADIGIPPDAEQQWLLDTIYCEKAPGRPQYFEVAGIGPRQNFKTSTMGVAGITDLFVFKVKRHVWSSHLVDTSKSTFRDFKTWIESKHEYADQCKFTESAQDLAITRTDPRTGVEYHLEFRSRTGKSSRGYTGVDRVTLDEALYLQPGHIGAIYPTMLTRPGAQVRVISSAGVIDSATLRSTRDKGRRGSDARMAYVEYGARRKKCADPQCSHIYGVATGCALDDRQLWWQANCALWAGRIEEDSILDLRKTMPWEEFQREMLSWWDDPVSEGGALPFRTWSELADPDAPLDGAVTWGLDLTGDRDVWIACAWVRADGMKQVMLANDARPIPAHTVVSAMKKRVDELGGAVSSSAFLEDLEKEIVTVHSVSGPDFAIACGTLEDGIRAGTIRHGNQEVLNTAIRLARWRPSLQTGERSLLLKDMPEVGPAAAVVRALHGLAQQETIPWAMQLDD